MASWAEVNAAAEAHTDFQVWSYQGDQLLIIGSFDLCYYHDIEVSFLDVSFIRCPMWFTRPRFRDAGPVIDGRRFVITAEEGDFEIIADSAEAIVGRVYHYDRGEQLLPGERVAEWVDRGRT